MSFPHRPAVNARELGRMYADNPQRTVQHLTESLEQGHLKAEDFSIRQLFIGLHENGLELLNLISDRKSGGRSLQEAAAAVDTSAFSNITGQIVFNRVKERYQDPTLLWPELCETIQTTFLNGEKIPGIGGLGDIGDATLTPEGQDYPTVGLNEEYIETAVLKKRGFKVPVTREAIIADRTSMLLKQAGDGAFYLGVNKEKRVQDVVWGNTNNYKRNGTAYNTFLSSGAYINTGSNTLTDWTSLQTAELLFDAITDPNTGEPILIDAVTLVVPTALKRTAHRILTASEVAHVDNQANAATIRTFSGNPYAGKSYKVLSNQYVKRATSSAAKWLFGDPKRAFAYMEAWGIETMEAADNNEAKFHRDIWQQFKVSEMGVAQVLEPRYVTLNT